MNDYSDLLITNGALTLAPTEPALTDTRASIAQDIKHMLLESGLVTRLIGERSQPLRASIMTEIELLVETDTRLVPGTITLTAVSNNAINLEATTYKYGNVEVTADAS